MEEKIPSAHEAYLDKKLKTRKISFAVVMGFVLALAVVILTLGCVKVDIRPQFVTDPSYVTIFKDGSSRILNTSDEKYQQFDKLYKDMFDVTYLSAIFSGQLGDYTIVETQSPFFTSATETENYFSSEISQNLGKNFVKLHFSETKNLYRANGNVYTSKYAPNEEFTYQDVYFALNEENVVKDFTFFFPMKGNIGGTSKSSTITKITLRANTSKLYKEFI